MMLRSIIICSGFLISGCSTITHTPDLNMHHLRAVDITEYDTSIVAMFCGTEAFNGLFVKELAPKIYPALSHSKNYLEFKAGFISDYSPNKHETWVGDVELNKFPEYRECGYGKKYPYIYWFEFNVEKNLPYKKEKQESYMRAYNEFKEQIVSFHHIELGVVKLPAFAGEVLVSENTSFLKLDEEQYATLMDEMK